MKPLIGITCNFIVANMASSTTTSHMPSMANVISETYVKAVEKAGGIPVIIPTTEDMDLVTAMIDRLDGVIISGGVDVDSWKYNHRPAATLGEICPVRDDLEIFIANYVIEKTNKPLLGICRGVQVMNVAAGGTLHQDLQSDGYEKHALNIYPRDYLSHGITIQPNSTLSEIYGDNTIRVNSFHHQAVRQVAPTYVAVAHSEDGVIEAIEHEKCNEGRFIIGVQWHPEILTKYDFQMKLFDEFINKSKNT